MMRNKLFSLIVFLLINACAAAQDSTVISQDERLLDDNIQAAEPLISKHRISVESADSTIYLHELNLNPDSVNAWKKSTDYNWIKNIDSLLRQDDAERKKKDKQDDKNISRIASSGDRNISLSPFLKILLWVFAGSFVLFIIYRLFLNQALFSRASAVKKTTAVEEDEVEDIAANDYTEYLRAAYNAGELRVAMRFLFLKTLQRLNQKDLIIFTKDKTNSNYLNEMPEAKRNNFASLALYYEYIWYGHAVISKEQFDAIENKFNHFLNKL